MHAHHLPSRLLILTLALLATLLSITAPGSATTDAIEPQTVRITDTRSGDGPCGFEIRRDIEGEVELTSAIDENGSLVLSIEPVSLHGTLTNPANGKTVELKWVTQNGEVAFGANGSNTVVTLPLTASFFRGYDTASATLEMTLPLDGAEIIDFEPGERSEDPWAHVCGLLA